MRAMEAQDPSTELTDQDRLLLVFDYLGPLALFSLVASRRELVGIGLLALSIVGIVLAA